MNTGPCTVLVWGDSIAASGWPQRAERIFNVALNVGRSIKVVNKGVGGLPAAVACGGFNDAVLPDRPEIVIIQFGLNDLRHDGSRGALPISTPDEFKRHLTAMVRMCLDRLNDTVILFGNHRTRPLLTMPTGLGYDETRAQYNEVTRHVARETGVSYCDIEGVMTAAGLYPEQVVAQDGIHLSPLGLEAYAQIAASELAKAVVSNCMKPTALPPE